MESLTLNDLVLRDEVGYSISEIVNAETKTSSSSPIIDIKFPQSHKVLDLRTLELGF